MPRPESKTLSVAAILAAGVLLSSCAAVQSIGASGTNGGFFPSLSQGESAEQATIDVQPLSDADRSAALDPLAAPPPGDAMSAAAGSEGSVRVPLGALNTPAPATAAVPAPKPNPPTARPATQPPIALTQTQPAQIQPAAASPPMPSAAMPSARTAPVPSPKTSMPAAMNASQMTDRPATTDMAGANMSEEPQTVVISSSGSRAEPMAPVAAREFIPAAPVVIPATLPQPPPPVALSVDDRNIVRRFEALRRLRDEELITAEEYNRRRNANLGGLLPYTQNPPGLGLERPVPSPDAIAARLQALGRSLEMRAITARQHELERTMILNALLSETPPRRAPRHAPPEDLLEAAAMVGKIEMLREDDLISDDEFDAEKAALEQFIQSGTLPADKREKSRRAESAQSEVMPKGPSTPPPPPITGAVLHLASFRTEEAAMRGWEQALAKNQALLANLRPVVRKADLGPQQGLFYRLMIGPFASLTDAESTCIELKKADQFCRATNIDG